MVYWRPLREKERGAERDGERTRVDKEREREIDCLFENCEKRRGTATEWKRTRELRAKVRGGEERES